MRILLAALGLLAISLNAAAECPADAEQRLYDMIQAIQLGEQSDVVPVAELAEWAVTTCSTRSHAQALAATLLSAVIPASAAPDPMRAYLALAETAISQNDYSWNPKLGAAILKNRDGSTIDYYGYAHATSTLLNTALPYAAALAEQGQVPRMLSGEAYEKCPYADHSAGRLMDEANLWNQSVEGKSDQPVYALAETRLTMLRASCPLHRRDLDYALARLYGQEVVRLSEWGYHYSELRQYQNAGWYWSNASLNASIFDEDEMKARKAELDARARPLAEKGKPYLDALFKLPPLNTGIDDERRREAAIWRKSADKLLAPD